MGCGDDGDDDGGGGSDVTAQQVVDQYAAIVYANYVDSRDDAVALKDAIDAFVAAPSEAGFDAARQAWLDSRDPYGQTEAFRFYAGPIDDDNGPEGQLNAWPMDEVYVDYVEGSPEAGIVNDTTIDITKEAIAGLNEGADGNIFDTPNFDPEKAVATGYHTIEFLLWGQDLNVDGPGARPYTDYLVDGEATAPNGDRRGQYLQIAAELLVDDLNYLVDAWAPDADNYRSQFVSGDTDDALRSILTGIGVLSKGELAAERMDNALDTLDQEDEHSCFSDNTKRDFEMNALGIKNVYTGTYGTLSGPSVDDLLRQTDSALADEMTDLLATTETAIAAIPNPVDQAIAVRESDGWNAINAAVMALFDQGDKIVEVGAALGLGNISVEIPE
ncbi:MAG: imelysin family protein [Myxococcota bacterium]